MPKDVAEYELRVKDKLSSGLDKASSKAARLDKNMSKAGKNAQSTGSVFGGLLKFNAFTMLADGALSLGKSILQAGANMEQTRVQFTTLLKDGEKANEVISNLQEFSNVTPFEADSVLKAGKVLTAFGTKTEDLMPTLKAIGDISAGTGKDFNELATIYGKAQVAGTLYAEDINQLVEAGIPVMGEFAKSLGTTEANVKKMASEGKLSFNDLQTAFANLSEGGGMFAGMMEEQSKTVGGLWSTLVGKFQVAFGQIGEAGENGFIHKILNSAITAFDWISNSMSQIGEVFAPLFEAFEPIQEAFSGLFDTMTGGAGITDILSGAFNFLGNVIEFISPVFKAIGRVFAAIINTIKKIVSAIVSWYKRTEWVQKLFKGFSASIVAGFTFIAEAASNILGGVGDLIAGIFSGDIDQIKRGINGLQNAFSDAGKKSAEAFEESYNSKSKDFFEEKAAKKETFKVDGKLSSIAARGSASRGRGATGKGTKKASSSVNGVSSGRPTTINVEIEKLIETFNVMAQNLDESETKIKNAVAKALVSAVNDVNLVAQ